MSSRCADRALPVQWMFHMERYISRISTGHDHHSDVDRGQAKATLEVMADSPPSPAGLDLGLVQCFTVVPEPRHAGRAAATLHVTQPTLSRQIRRLEQQLGVRPTGPGGFSFPPPPPRPRWPPGAAPATRAAAEPSHITIGYTTGPI